MYIKSEGTESRNKILIEPTHQQNSILEYDVKKLGETWFEYKGKNPIADLSSFFIKDTREDWEDVGTVKIS